MKKLAEEEEKTKHLLKNKNKFESTQQEYEDQLNKERQVNQQHRNFEFAPNFE